MKNFVLAVFAVVSLTVGVWLIISPSLERDNHLEQQNELMGLLDGIITDRTGEVYDTETTMPAYISMSTESEADITMPPTIGIEANITTPPAIRIEADITMPSTYDIAVSTYNPIYYEDYEPISYYYVPETLNILIHEPELLPTPEPLDLSAFPQGIVPLGIMTIEAIDLRLPVMEGVNEPELRIAPGRVPETAVTGEIGNAVIAGHRNVTFGSMFNRLGDVETGDIIQFQGLDGGIMEFEVFEISVILPADQIAFVQPQNKAIITLYTCTPIREATHRLIIRAVKI